MEISNRTLGIAAASVVLITVSMRSQSSSLGAQSTISVPTTTARANQIPDSDFSLVNPPDAGQTSGGNVPTLNMGTPNSNLIKLNQGGAIVPGVTKVETDVPTVVSPSGAPYPQDNSAGSGSGDESQRFDWPWDKQGSDSRQMSDSDLYDALMDSMSDEDQQAFRMTWDVLSPADRERIFSSLRATSGR